MKTKILYILFFNVILTFSLRAQPANDDCISATSLTSNAACTNGTTSNATLQLGEVNSGACLGATATESIWYTFTATSLDMYLNIELTGASGGGFISTTGFGSIIYNTSSCIPTLADAISCEVDNGDGLQLHSLTGLTVGNTYLVQVVNRSQGFLASVDFCIAVGDQPTPCETCSSPCGAACGFETNPPTAQTVIDSCGTGYVQMPMLAEDTTVTMCYTFTATDDTVDFSTIITSNCSGGGNVVSLTWELYQTGSCGGTVQTGDINNLQFTGLGIGTNYTYCYTFTVPSNCHHTIHNPYFVGAEPIPLSLDLVEFYGKNLEKGNQVSWVLESTENRNQMTLEHSEDGFSFSELETISYEDGISLNSSENTKDLAAIYVSKFKDASVGKTNIGEQVQFSYLDENPVLGINYYRLKQLDLDGNFEYSIVLELNVVSTNTELIAYPNPVKDQLNLKLLTSEKIDASKQVKIYDIFGKEAVSFQASEFVNKTKQLNIENLNSGIYILRFKDMKYKFIKQ